MACQHRIRRKSFDQSSSFVLIRVIRGSVLRDVGAFAPSAGTRDRARNVNTRGQRLDHTILLIPFISSSLPAAEEETGWTGLKRRLTYKEVRLAKEKTVCG
jgi:hypothetical protein